MFNKIIRLNQIKTKMGEHSAREIVVAGRTNRTELKNQCTRRGCPENPRISFVPGSSNGQALASIL